MVFYCCTVWCRLCLKGMLLSLYCFACKTGKGKMIEKFASDHVRFFCPDTLRLGRKSPGKPDSDESQTTRKNTCLMVIGTEAKVWMLQPLLLMLIDMIGISLVHVCWCKEKTQQEQLWLAPTFYSKLVLRQHNDFSLMTKLQNVPLISVFVDF